MLRLFPLTLGLLFSFGLSSAYAIKITNLTDCVCTVTPTSSKAGIHSCSKYSSYIVGQLSYGTIDKDDKYSQAGHVGLDKTVDYQPLPNNLIGWTLGSTDHYSQRLTSVSSNFVIFLIKGANTTIVGLMPDKIVSSQCKYKHSSITPHYLTSFVMKSLGK